MRRNKVNLLISFLLGVCTAIEGKKIFRKNGKTGQNDKIYAYYDVLNKWMMLKEGNETVEGRLREKGIKTIAIYGMGDLGKHLKKDLEDTEIEVKYVIDGSLFVISDIDVYEPESDMPPVDAIIVTPVLEYENICRVLRRKTDCKILSIADIVGNNVS